MTLEQLEEVQVTQVKSKDVHGFTAIQVGAGERKAKNLSMSVMGHLGKAGAGAKAVLAEFTVSDDAVVPEGNSRNADQHTTG